MQRGYAAMTLEDVMDSIGISKTTLYAHFRSKEELAASVLLREMERVEAFLRSLNPRVSAADRLAEFVRWCFAMRFREPRLMLGDFAQHLRPSGKANPRVVETEQRITDTLEKIVAEGQKEGDLRADISATILVQLVIGVVRDDGYETMLADGRITLPEITEGILRLLSART